MDKKPGPGEVTISEPWLLEWVEHGYQQLVAYLTLHAAFDAYCVEHPTPKETL